MIMYRWQSMTSKVLVWVSMFVLDVFLYAPIHLEAHLNLFSPSS